MYMSDISAVILRVLDTLVVYGTAFWQDDKTGNTDLGRCFIAVGLHTLPPVWCFTNKNKRLKLAVYGEAFFSPFFMQNRVRQMFQDKKNNKRHLEHKGKQYWNLLQNAKKYTLRQTKIFCILTGVLASSFHCERVLLISKCYLVLLFGCKQKEWH